MIQRSHRTVDNSTRNSLISLQCRHRYICSVSVLPKVRLGDEVDSAVQQRRRDWLARQILDIHRPTRDWLNRPNTTLTPASCPSGTCTLGPAHRGPLIQWLILRIAWEVVGSPLSVRGLAGSPYLTFGWDEYLTIFYTLLSFWKEL